MNISSIINAINNHMQQLFDWFGGQSEEYMNAMKQVRDNLPDSVLQQTQSQGLNYVYDNPTKPLKLSTGKQSKEILQNFENDLQELRVEQKESGTALEQAQKYIDDLKKDGRGFSRKSIKESASGIYNFRNNVNAWYKEVIESTVITEAEKSYFKEPYSELNGSDPYEYGVLRQKITENYNRLKPKLDEEKESKLREESEKEADNAISNGFEIDPLTQI